MASRQKDRKSKEDTWTKQELSREMKSIKHEVKPKRNPPLTERKREREDDVKHSFQSPKTTPKADSKATLSPLSSTKSMSPAQSPKSIPKAPSSRSSKSVDQTSSYKGSAQSPKSIPKIESKSSPKLSGKPNSHSPQLHHSPKHKRENKIQDDKKTSRRDKDSSTRHSSKKVGNITHPLSETHIALEEEIEEDINLSSQPINKVPIDPIPMEEITEDIQDNGGDNYSNDEFEEDYEEDFEEDIEFDDRNNDRRSSPPSDLDDLLQAINDENKTIQVEPAASTATEPSASHHNAALSPRPAISFTTVKSIKAKETSEKVRTRANELSKMIERDVLSIHLLELEPLTEYDLYMRSFGQDNTSQTGTQTGEDLIENESQTDPIIFQDRWTQWPPHDMKGYGGVDVEDLVVEYDSEKLLKFLEKASLVCYTILEEESLTELEATSSVSLHKDKYCMLDYSLVSSGVIQCIDWNQLHSNILLICCTYSGGGWSGLLEVWQISNHMQPQHYLGVHSNPVSCCLKYPLIFSGNEDGSIVVWDLREPLSLHKHRLQSTQDKMIRAPTYTTAALGYNENGHTQPVLNLSSSTLQDTTNTQSSLSFQLLSIDCTGRVCVWIVVELSEGNPSGSQMDLGLAPNGRVKLVPSTFIDAINVNSVGLSATCLSVNSNTLFIGTNMSNVIRHTRYKPTVVPKQYTSSRAGSSVTSLSFHPHFNSYFLVAFSDGHIALYNLHWSQPLLAMPPYHENKPITDITWHTDWSSVFVCISGDQQIHIWNLLATDFKPFYVIELEQKISTLKLINDSSSSYMVVGNKNNEVGVYKLESSRFELQNHLDLFDNYLLNLI